MGTKYIDGDLHVKGKLWQNEEEVNVLFVDGNTGNINNNAVIITGMPGSSRDIISILKPIAGWGLANAKKFVDSLSVGIDLRTHSIDNLQLTDPQIAEFVKQTTEQNLMTFKIPAGEGGTGRLKEITVTKGNKSIIFNNATEIDIPSVALNTTVNTESITIGSDTLKVMTTDTNQTISSDKTIAYGSKTNYALNNGNVYDLSGNQYNYLQIGYNGIGMYSFGNSQFFPNSNNSRDLGTQELSWRNLYLAQNLSDGTNSITVAEIAAKQDAVKVKRYI